MMSVPRVGVLLAVSTTTSTSPEYLCVYQNASKLWGFPKGRCRNFEPYTQGACRELLEETGIKIHFSELSTDIMHHIKRGKHHHYYFVKEMTRKPVVTVDGDEIIGYKWMTISELSKMNVSYFTDQIVKKLNTTNTTTQIPLTTQILDTISPSDSIINTFQNNLILV